jgi:ligand-binding sensor domain-containing protein
MNLSRHCLGKAPVRRREAFTFIELLFVIGLASLSSFAALGAGAPIRQDSEWIIKTWETGDGLPDNSVTAIAQTPDGYIWLGTFNGLVRFNGVEFKVFNPANTPQLPSGGIVNLHVDHAGRLLVSTYRGLVMLEGTEWRTLSTPGTDFVRSFAERGDGDLLMTMFGGKVLELSKSRVSELPSPPKLKNGWCFCGADEEGHWWVAQSGFIGRWDDRGWTQSFIGATSC